MVESAIEKAEKEYKENVSNIFDNIGEQVSETAKVFQEVMESLRNELGPEEEHLRRMISNAQHTLLSKDAMDQV